MACFNIASLQLSDTFNTWFTRTNQVITTLNNIEIKGLSVYDNNTNNYFGQIIRNENCYLTSEIVTGPFINFISGDSGTYGAGTSANPRKITLTFPNASAFLADRQLTGNDELIINDGSVQGGIPVKRIKASNLVPSVIDVSYLRIQNRTQTTQGATLSFYANGDAINTWSGISASSFSAERVGGYLPSTEPINLGFGNYKPVIPVTNNYGLIPDSFVRLPLSFRLNDLVVPGFDATADVKSFDLSAGKGISMTTTVGNIFPGMANAISYEIEALIPATGNGGPYGMNLFNINGYWPTGSSLSADARSLLSVHSGLSGGKGIKTNLTSRNVALPVRYIIPGDPNTTITYTGMTAVDIFTIAENPDDSNYVRKIGDVMTGTLTGTSTNFVFENGEILNTLTADNITNTTLFTGKNLKTTLGYAQFSLNPAGGTFTVNNNNTPTNHILQIVSANSTVSLNNGDHVFTDDNISLDKDGTGVVQIGYAGPQSGKSFFVNGDSQFDGNVNIMSGLEVSGGMTSDFIKSVDIISSSLTSETLYSPMGVFVSLTSDTSYSQTSYSQTANIEFLNSTTGNFGNIIFDNVTGTDLYSSNIIGESISGNNFYRFEATGGSAPNFSFADNELITKALLDIFVPPGTVLPYAGQTLPEGYLWCDGADYPFNDSKYSNLFYAIGFTYGIAQGNRFKVPDLKSKFIKGNNPTNTQLGQTGGNASSTITLESKNLPPHTHLFSNFDNDDNSSSIRYLRGPSNYEGWNGIDAHGDEDAPGRDRGSLNHAPFSSIAMRPVASANPDPITDSEGMQSIPITIAPFHLYLNYIIKY